VEELAALGGVRRLRDFGIPESDLPSVAAAVVERPGAKANPRPATPDEVEALLRSIH
jgi:alcohol dehydrogenase class IV